MKNLNVFSGENKKKKQKKNETPIHIYKEYCNHDL